MSQHLGCNQFGSSGGGTRTHNLRINSPPLCRLSYPGRWSVGQSTSGPFARSADGGRLSTPHPRHAIDRKDPRHEAPLAVARRRRHRHRLHARHQDATRTTPTSCAVPSASRTLRRARAAAGVRRSAAHRRSGGRAEPRCDPPSARSDPLPAVASTTSTATTPAGTERLGSRLTASRRDPERDRRRRCSAVQSAGLASRHDRVADADRDPVADEEAVPRRRCTRPPRTCGRSSTRRARRCSPRSDRRCRPLRRRTAGRRLGGRRASAVSAVA